MKNNEYKKYFDKVSPEQNLVEQTKKKMYDELNNQSSSKNNIRESFIRYGILAACAVIATVSVAVVPKPGKTNITDQDCIQSNNQIDKSSTDIQYTSLTQKNTNIGNSVVASESSDVGSAEKITVIDGYVTTNPVYYFDKNESDFGNSVKNTSAATNKGTQSVSIPKHTSDNFQTSSPKLTQIIVTSAIPVSDVVTMPAITVPPITTIVGTADSVISYTTTCPDYRPGLPDITGGTNDGDSDVPDHVYYIADVQTYNYSGKIYMNIENEYKAPSFTNSIPSSMDEVKKYFGKDICPQQLIDQYPDYLIKAEGNCSLENGIGMIFGEYTGLDLKNSKYVVMSASDNNNTCLGYTIFSANPLYTSINGKTYTFSVLSQYPDAYFCSFEQDGIYYNFCFKNYDLADIIQLILSF